MKMKPSTLILAALPMMTALTWSQQALADNVTYTIDPSHTMVTFEAARHFGTSTTRGRFDKTTGTVVLDRSGKRGQAAIDIDLASVSTGVPLLDQHLRGEDFFNVTNHPVGRFVSERFVFSGDQLTSVEGTLTLHGKSLPLTLKAQYFNCYDNPYVKREVCGGDFEAVLQRSLWGMGYGAPAIPDQIRLMIQVEAIRQP